MKRFGRWISRLGRAANRGAGQLGNLLGGLLLFVMFITMMLIGADAMFQAYRDLHCANAKIEQTLSEVENHLKNLYATGVSSGRLTPESEAFLKCLEAGSKDGLGSNAISFLFQVFSICLVSAGVYLLNRAHRNLKVAEEKVALIGPFIANSPVSSAILGYLLAAYQTTWLLRTATDRTVQSSYIAHTRDSIMVLLKPQLQRAAQDGRGIEPSHYGIFMDLLTGVKVNLERFEDSERVWNLIAACEECVRLLKESGFVENYRKQLEKLLDKPEEEK